MTGYNYIRVEDGSYLNLDMVTRLKASGKALFAECPSQTVTIKNFASPDEAKSALKVFVFRIVQGEAISITHFFKEPKK